MREDYKCQTCGQHFLAWGDWPDDRLLDCPTCERYNCPNGCDSFKDYSNEDLAEDEDPSFEHLRYGGSE